ncbi:MAG: S41 family peptidase [Bacteroidales bacterium]
MNNISYRFLDDENKTMYFRLNSVMAREAFLFMYQNKWNGYEKQIESYYKNMLKKTMPTNIDSAIAGIPTIAEQFGNMLEQMKKQKSKNLIIDLRYNGGGFTPIILPTLYQLYGDKYLQTNMGTCFYTLISPLYLQKLNISLEEYNKMNNSSYELGDYKFDNESGDNQSIEQIRANFAEHSLGNASQYILGLKGKPVYTPNNVFVITNEQTFSAAFHYAFYLWKMGATIVGIPSSQAPNTFMEQTPFTLPLTKIAGSISNAAQYFLPSTDKRAKIFYPQYMPTYNHYKKYNFDRQTELLYLLDNYIK